MVKAASKKGAAAGRRATKAPSGPARPDDPHWLDRLNTLLRQREIGRGIALLDQTEPLWASLKVPGRSVADLLLTLAQWVDVGYRDSEFLRGALDLLPPAARLGLDVGAYVRVRMAEAFHALSVDNADETIRSLDVVLRLDRDLLGANIKILAHLWKGRAHRQKAQYELALAHIDAACELAASLPDAKTILAVIQVQQGWLIFQRGDVARSLQVFDEADAVLKHTDHWLALGNIESAKGRIIRRQGDYVRALHHFERAVSLYEIRHPNHPNLARAVTNLAFVKRLLALQLKRHIDSAVARRETSARGSDGPRLQPLHKQYQDLYRSAIAALDRAKRICHLNNHQGGLATALLNAGHLHLDIGDLDRAEREAAETYAIADRSNSTVLKARARILTGLIENSHVEESLGHSEEAPAFARRARQHCTEAVALAQSTQNKRLLLNAQLALGEVAVNNFFHDYDLARRCADAASALLEADDADYVIDDLNALKAKLLRTVGIDDTLRAWSQGIATGKTLQEVMEDFAELFVTQVWLRQDRKVSRVANQLTMSPKKVRRLVKRAGLSDPSR